MANKTLGPYLIDRRLGHGGMGTVYAGVHEQTGQWAAIKVLSENLNADPRFRERFQGEVETLKLLNHPNIVTLIGYGEEDGQLFFVMELVDGLSLEGALQAGRRFQWDQVIDIAVQVCAALKHAHDHGVIHRDLKPANLLLTPNGTVKLTDFGIAKLFGVSGLTMAGSMIGTPDYMSPEQTEGFPATGRSDLYSLGCVMYALISGKPPFTSPSITKIIDRVRTVEALPLRRLVPDLPEPMERIVAQLLNKDPAQRIATPQALANLLRAMKHALTSKSPEPEPDDRAAARPFAADRRRASAGRAERTGHRGTSHLGFQHRRSATVQGRQDGFPRGRRCAGRSGRDDRVRSRAPIARHIAAGAANAVYRRACGRDATRNGYRRPG
jgi:eukaryotic-like serine/threonine-protein kinase